MVTPYADGEVGVRSSDTTALHTSVFLASPGTVDTNFPTRIQYNKPRQGPGETPGVFSQDYLGAIGRFNFTQAEIDNLNPGQRYTATMFIAPASAFAPGVVPTPGQIHALGNSLIIRRSLQSATVAGDRYLGILGPRAGSGTLTPGTKYWVLVTPTKVTWGSTVSFANDEVYGPASTHRAVSVTTNHSPVKPTIVTPSATVVQVPGSIFDLTFDSGDDLDYNPSYQNALTWNINGVQVQKAAVPANPATPLVWSDVAFRSTYYFYPGPPDLDDTVDEPGYYLEGAGPVAPFGAQNTGAIRMMQDGTTRVLAGWPDDTIIPLPPGVDPPTEDEGSDIAPAMLLPSGDWYLRIRTFDPGGEGSYYPINYTDGNFTPDSYPAYNKSPWSDSVRVIIPSSVPAPVPLSPRDNVAQVIGSNFSLRWQYRNSYSPPKAQKAVEVRMRVLNLSDGVSIWYTAFNGLTAATGLTITPAYALTNTAGRLIEWQVRATDTANVQSDWSESAFFWTVAVPDSGNLRPVPSSTIDGATLGCGTHRVFIYKRGGKVRVGELTSLSHVEWGRLRDDISDARIVVSGWSIDCGNLLALLQTWAYEIVIFRDNGYSVDRVWEGPITLLTYEHDKVTIKAKDVMVWAYRRIIKQAMNDTGSSTTAGRSVVARAAAVIQNAFAPDDPNVLGYLKVLTQSDDPKQYRSLPAYSRTAYEEVDDMAANAGLDYTAVGRSILLWATKHRIGLLPEFRDEDLGATPIVSEYGMSFANRYAVSDGNGVYGEATRGDEAGENPEDSGYGLIEMLSSSWASDSAEDTGTYTQAGLETVRESFRESAEHSIGDRFPPPVVVRIPDNTTINPSAVISIQQLVPGVAMPLRSTSTLRSVVATQKLDSVRVIEVDSKETITITLSPFSRDDDGLDPEEV